MYYCTGTVQENTLLCCQKSALCQSVLDSEYSDPDSMFSNKKFSVSAQFLMTKLKSWRKKYNFFKVFLYMKVIFDLIFE